MKVKLSGSAFDIFSLNNSETMVITLNEKTIWNWNVTPKSSGKKELTLCLTVEIKIGGSKESKDYPIVEKLVEVHVDRVYSTKKFLEKNWQWMVGTAAGSGVVFSLLKAVGIIK